MLSFLKVGNKHSEQYKTLLCFTMLFIIKIQVSSWDNHSASKAEAFLSLCPAVMFGQSSFGWSSFSDLWNIGDNSKGGRGSTCSKYRTSVTQTYMAVNSIVPISLSQFVEGGR